MKKTLLYKRVVTVLFTLLLAGFLSSQTVIVKGKVKEGIDVLSLATVSIGNKTVLTNEAGEFSISIPPGAYLFIISHVGYIKIKQSVSIDSTNVQSIEFNLTRDELLMGEVVKLGSRSTVQRSNLSTPVPVDVFSTNKLMQTGQASLTQMLNFAAPSFNASRQLLNEPVTLRGLDPDHLLILMNDTRYHNTAWLNNGILPGQLGRGSVGNDLNSIPFSAIDKIEILRDGASAQYGSDAIAGVINIHLKESADNSSIHVHTGQFYEGDGLKFSFGFNRGIHLKKGFLNYSADLNYQSPTFRGGNYEGTVYYIIPIGATPADSAIIRDLDNQKIRERGFNRKYPVSNVGILEFFSSGFSVNGGYPINNHTELFWTGMVNNHKNLYNAVYRYPKNKNQVNTTLFPDGFKARVETKNWDVSGIAGAKGETRNRLHWEISSAFGNNSSINNVANTNNASQQFTLGKNAPTAFYLGEMIFNQLTNNISFTKDLTKNNGRIKSINLGFGAELRFENYQKKEGEEASWKNYDTTSRLTQSGSQGSPGINLDNAVNKNRTIAGTYIDLETEINDHFLFDLACRYEYYNDFGGNLAGKLAARYKFSEKFSVRGSVSNGFRAPSMQQLFSGGTSTVFANVGPGGIRVPVIQGTFDNDSKVSKAFGVPPLQAERSINLSGGFTSKLSQHISLTTDVYWIQIKNRVILSGVFDKANPDVATILAGYPDIDLVQFYTNAINTRTCGIDIIINGNWNINKANLELTLSANFNHNQIFGEIKTTDSLPSNSLNTNTLFGIVERTNLEKGQPNSKIILTSTFNIGKFGFIFRNTRFGKTARTNLVKKPTDTLYEFFSPKILTDISINYTPKTWLTITAGANNIFDVYPDRLKNYGNTAEGIFIYSNEASPFGFNGGYYYVSMAFNF